MASSTSETVSTSAPPAEIPAADDRPTVATETSNSVPEDLPHLTSPAPNIAVKPTTPISPKQQDKPTFELTGAAALADQRRHDEEMAEQATPKTSPNPAKTALMAATTPSEGFSRMSDAPPAQASAATQEPISEPSGSTIVAEPMEIDSEPPSQQVVTASPEPGAKPSDYHANNAEASDSSKKRPGTPSLKNDDRSNKAFTYPPPPEIELPTPARNMSLPTAGTRSPSTKKHKCPHCATEFTRHHNLKSHLLTHSQEKPYGCEQCSQRFRRLHDLKRHLKLHTGERPHTCNICGRKFARGDALARHNKGPGGCAGRRESAGGEDYDDLEGDMDVDGQYPGDDSQEGQSTDEQGSDSQRRRSEPNRRARRTSSKVEPPSANYRHTSTYPPVAPTSAGPRGDMPPPGSSTTSQPRESTSQRHLSPHPPGASFISVHYNGPSSTYSHGGMTESPKPLSPGQPDPHRHNSEGSVGRNRSPSLATKLQHQHFGKNSGANTPPISLPPPNSSSHQQLPSISGLDPRFNGSTYPPSTSSSYRPPIVTGPGSSGPPSASSQHQSSGGSTRELFGGSGPPQDEGRLMDYIRSIESRLHEEKTLRIKEREERDSIIRMMQHEMDMLKSQIPQAQNPHGHRSSH